MNSRSLFPKAVSWAVLANAYFASTCGSNSAFISWSPRKLKGDRRRQTRDLPAHTILTQYQPGEAL